MPGFAGGDRTDIALPQSQQALLEALHATGKPVVVVLMRRLCAGHRVGRAARARHPHGVVSGPAGWRSHRRRPLRRREPVGTAAGDVLQVGRPAAAVRRLQHEGAHLPLLHRRAALPVRLRVVVHTFRLLEPAALPSGQRVGPGGRVGGRHQRRHPLRSRGRAAIRTSDCTEGPDAHPGPARIRTPAVTARRAAHRVVPAADLGDDGLLRRSSERLHGGAGTVPRSASAHRAATSARRRGSSSAPTLLGGRFVPARDMGQRNRSRARIAVTASRLRRARTAARERAEMRVLPECGRSRRSEMAAPVD